MKLKMNVVEILKSRGELIANMKVFSNVFTQELSIIGFIPFNEFDLLLASSPQINLNEDVIYTSYRIRLESLNLTLPVMKNIRIVTNEEKFECKRKLITKYPIKLFENYYHVLENSDLEETAKKRGLEYNANRVLKNSTKDDMGEKRLFADDDSKLFYQAKENDLVLTRAHGEYTVISNEFACLCAYTNPITGKPAYALYNAEDLYLFEVSGNKNG